MDTIRSQLRPPVPSAETFATGVKALLIILYQRGHVTLSTFQHMWNQNASVISVSHSQRKRFFGGLSQSNMNHMCYWFGRFYLPHWDTPKMRWGRHCHTSPIVRDYVCKPESTQWITTNMSQKAKTENLSLKLCNKGTIRSTFCLQISSKHTAIAFRRIKQGKAPTILAGAGMRRFILLL